MSNPGFEPGLSRHPSLVAKLKEFQKNPVSLIFVALAEEYRSLGFAAQALEILSEGLFFHKDLLAAWVVKARALADLRRYAESLALVNQILRRSPEHIRALQLQADIFLRLGQKIKALESLERILFLFPGDKETARKANEITRLLDAERPPLEPIVEDLRERPGELRDFQVGSLASLAESAEWEHESVLEEASAVMRQTSHDAPIATRTIAELYMRQGLQQKALEVLRRMLDADPENTWVRDTLQDLQANSAFPHLANRVVFDHQTILNKKAQFLERALTQFQLGLGSRRSFS